MIKKLVIAAVAAGALAVPLAGAAWADKPVDPGSQGVGAGGVPAAIGNAQNPPTGPITVGSIVSAGAKSEPGAVAGQKPGQVLKASGITPGGGHPAP